MVTSYFSLLFYHPCSAAKHCSLGMACALFQNMSPKSNSYVPPNFFLVNLVIGGGLFFIERHIVSNCLSFCAVSSH